MKVLIADDDADILETTALVLELDHHEVFKVPRAADIVAACKAARPDLLLQDVGMPGLDLAEHLALLAADPETAGIPILIFSAREPEPATLEAPGVIGYLSKPFPFSDLRDWLARVAGD